MPTNTSQPDNAASVFAAAAQGQIVRTTRQTGGFARSTSFRIWPKSWGWSRRDTKRRRNCVAAVQDRQTLIANMDRQAMLDVIRWGRRPLAVNATLEQIAREIVCIKSMRFAGLSQRGLVVLARLRGIRRGRCKAVPELIQSLKKTGRVLQPDKPQTAGDAGGVRGQYVRGSPIGSRLPVFARRFRRDRASRGRGGFSDSIKEGNRGIGAVWRD